MEGLSYSHISTVLNSWEMLKQRVGTPEQFGTLLLENLFAIEPKAKEVFGFSIDYNVASPLAKMGLLVHGLRMVSMFDSIFSSVLGPDLETAAEILAEVGQRHERLGVSKEWFPAMGKSLTSTLGETAGESFNDNVSNAWKNVFDAISEEMSRGMS